MSPRRRAPAYNFSSAAMDEGSDLLGIGGDLRPETLLQAYASGVFPMGVGEQGAPPMGWWSPAERGVLALDELRVSRSLRRSSRRFEVSSDRAFAAVVEGCADPGREGRWITPQIAQAYADLHRQGHAHSIEVWLAGELVGGLYGVAIGGLFAGESMFHRVTDASKVALVALVEVLRTGPPGPRLVDVQWRTDHLASLGVVAIPRRDYLRLLPSLVATPGPNGWGGVVDPGAAIDSGAGTGTRGPRPGTTGHT